jgi:rubrerythrin
MSRTFESLSPLEVLALAVNVEQANARRFRAFADVFQGYDAAVAARFQELAVEEDEHESLLTAQFRKRFGEVIPVVDEVEVEGVIESVDVDDAEHLIFSSLEPTRVYELALRAERGAQEFYKRAMARTTDEALSTLYRELAEMEDDHAGWLEEKLRTLGTAGKDVSKRAKPNRG